MEPVLLAANLPSTFYRGSGGIARFRGSPDLPPRPEDWVASTTTRFGSSSAGLSALPSGRLLRDAIADSPERWLGPAHVDRYGADPAILVKLLDAGERLPVHVHPDRRFATAHLASPYGKTEAWVILEAAPDAVVYLGFSRAVGFSELVDWVVGQRIDSMLAATNSVPVRAGDSVLVPAGLPHAIGAGVLLVEVQEATDFSVVLEASRFGLDEAAAFAGLPRELALSCVDRRSWAPSRVASLRRDRGARLLPDAADEFFRAERASTGSVLDAGFSVVVVTSGRGTLGALAVAAGDTVVVPYAAGALRVSGDVSAIRLRPPDPGPRRR
jgi:mannose-6-phosphate isomerase